MFEDGSEGYYPKVQILATLETGGWTGATHLAKGNAGVIRNEKKRPLLKG